MVADRAATGHKVNAKHRFDLFLHPMDEKQLSLSLVHWLVFDASTSRDLVRSERATIVQHLSIIIGLSKWFRLVTRGSEATS